MKGPCKYCGGAAAHRTPATAACRLVTEPRQALADGLLPVGGWHKALSDAGIPMRQVLSHVQPGFRGKRQKEAYAHYAVAWAVAVARTGALSASGAQAPFAARVAVLRAIAESPELRAAAEAVMLAGEGARIFEVLRLACGVANATAEVTL